eukprot:58754-Pyramimonas_sp.AAC.1
MLLRDALAQGICVREVQKQSIQFLLRRPPEPRAPTRSAKQAALEAKMTISSFEVDVINMKGGCRLRWAWRRGARHSD